MKQDLKEIFSKIYADNIWGGRPGQLYSGGGSDVQNTTFYVEKVNRFLDEKNIKTIVDLGCGDFRVAGRLNLQSRTYIGVDIVPFLIESNRARYADDFVTFECLNLVEDELPEGDLCLIRQVFQHLSNQDIQSILKKLDIYPYVLVTDGLPVQEKSIPNPDKASDNFTRHDLHGSGLYLEYEPFNVKGEVLFEYTLGHERLRTFGFTNHPSRGISLGSDS